MTQSCVLSLGFFDGVHLGHAGLLRRTRALADKLGVCAAALTFDVHPDTLVRGLPIPLLNTPEERIFLMKTLYGIDEVQILHFDRATMNLPWEDFLTQTVIGEYHAVHVVCGHDFRFGAYGEGTPEKLAQLCSSLHCGFDCISEICMESETVSSSRIRDLLNNGEIAKAVRFLGHPHFLSGKVVGGKQLGRTLGIPTANLEVSPQILLPKRGVYAAKAHFDGLERFAVVNIGCRPTVGGETVTVEPWILDFDGNLYGHRICLSLYEFLRPEKKFESLDVLRTEIQCNAAQTRRFFEQN